MVRKEEKNGQPEPDLRGNKGRWGNQPKPVFIEGYLNADDQEWLQAHVGDQLALISELLLALDDTYGLSCKYDSNSERFMATLTCRVQNHHNSGCILVSRGSDTVNALYALAYRHFVKFDGKWRDHPISSESLWD